MKVVRYPHHDPTRRIDDIPLPGRCQNFGHQTRQLDCRQGQWQNAQMFTSQPIIQALADGIRRIVDPRSKRNRGWRRVAEHNAPDPIDLFAKSEVNLAGLIKLLLADVPAVVTALNHHESPLDWQILPQRLGHPLVLKKGPA